MKENSKLTNKILCITSYVLGGSWAWATFLFFPQYNVILCIYTTEQTIENFYLLIVN
jgi:hypothetical protein